MTVKDALNGRVKNVNEKSFQLYCSEVFFSNFRHIFVAKLEPLFNCLI